VKLVAIGSSSTSGYGASAVDSTYPSRLAAHLRARYPQAAIDVLNSGKPGDTYLGMLARFDRHVLGHSPDLVLWQVGTNSLLWDSGVTQAEPHLREGVRRIRAAGADVILIDPQYAPRVLRDPDAEPMVALLAKIARTEGAGLFRRFALMRYWQETRRIPFQTMLRHDMFHMNDWSYGCWAEHFARAIAAAVGPPRPNAAGKRTTSGTPKRDRASAIR
jgi:lysophospholipase L1-like esterase